MALPSLPYMWPLSWLAHCSCSSGLGCPCHFDSCSPCPRSAAPEPRDSALLRPCHFLSGRARPRLDGGCSSPASSLPQHPPQHLPWRRALRWPKVEGHFIPSTQPLLLVISWNPCAPVKVLSNFPFLKTQLDYPVLIGPVCLASVWPFGLGICHCST